MNRKEKLKEIFGSRKFYASLLTIILLTLKESFGIDLPIEDGGELYDRLVEIFVLVSSWIIVPIGSAIKKAIEGNFNKSFFFDSNFITALFTVLGMPLSVYLSEELIGTITIIAVNIINIIYQSSKPSKKSLMVNLPKTPDVVIAK